MSTRANRMTLDPAVSSTRYCRATVTASERIAVPSSMAGKVCIFQADAQDVYVAFGGGAVVASATQVSGLAAEVLTADGKETLHIPADTSIERRLDSDITHFAHISPATTGFFRFAPDTGDGE